MHLMSTASYLCSSMDERIASNDKNAGSTPVRDTYDFVAQWTER